MAQQPDVMDFLSLKPIGFVAFKTTDVLVKDTKRGLIYGVGYVLASSKPDFKSYGGLKSDAASNDSSQNAVERAPKIEPSASSKKTSSAAAKSTSNNKANSQREQVKFSPTKADVSSNSVNHAETVPRPIINDAINKQKTKDSIKSVATNISLLPRTPEGKISTKNKGKSKAEPKSVIREQLKSSPPVVPLNPELKLDDGADEIDVLEAQRFIQRTTAISPELPKLPDPQRQLISTTRDDSPPDTIVSATELQNPFIKTNIAQPSKTKQAIASQPLRSRFKTLAKPGRKVDRGDTFREEEEQLQESSSSPLPFLSPRALDTRSNSTNIPSEVPVLVDRMDLHSKPKVDMTLRNIFLQNKQREKDLSRSGKQPASINEEVMQKPLSTASQSETRRIPDMNKGFAESDKSLSRAGEESSSKDAVPSVVSSLGKQSTTTTVPVESSSQSLDSEPFEAIEPVMVSPVSSTPNPAQAQEQFEQEYVAQKAVADDKDSTANPLGITIADDARDSSGVTGRIGVKNAIVQQTSAAKPSTSTKDLTLQKTKSTPPKPPVVPQALPTQRISIAEEEVEQVPEPLRTSLSQLSANKSELEQSITRSRTSLDNSDIDNAATSAIEAVSGPYEEIGESTLMGQSNLSQNSKPFAVPESETTPKAKTRKDDTTKSLYTEPETTGARIKDISIRAEVVKAITADRVPLEPVSVVKASDLKPQKQSPEARAQSTTPEVQSTQSEAPEIQTKPAQVEVDTTPRAKRISTPVQTEDRSYSSLSWSDDDDGLSPAMGNQQSFQESQIQFDATTPRPSASTLVQTDLVPSVPSTNTQSVPIWQSSRTSQPQSANSSRRGSGQSQRFTASSSGGDSRPSSAQSQHAKTSSARSKVLCWEVQMNKPCSSRGKCPYSHDKSTGICHYYYKGNCKFGERCGFRHDSTQDSRSKVLAAETSTPISPSEPGGKKQMPKWLEDELRENPIGDAASLLPPVDNDLLHGPGWQNKFAQAGYTAEEDDDQYLDDGGEATSGSGMKFPEGMQHSRWATPTTGSSEKPSSGKGKEFPAGMQHSRWATPSTTTSEEPASGRVKEPPPQGMQHSRWATPTTTPSEEQSTQSITTTQTKPDQATVPSAPSPAISGGGMSQSIYATAEPASSSSKETPAPSKTSTQKKPAARGKGGLSSGMGSSRWA